MSSTSELVQILAALGPGGTYASAFLAVAVLLVLGYVAFQRYSKDSMQSSHATTWTQEIKGLIDALREERNSQAAAVALREQQLAESGKQIQTLIAENLSQQARIDTLMLEIDSLRAYSTRINNQLIRLTAHLVESGIEKLSPQTIQVLLHPDARGFYPSGVPRPTEPTNPQPQTPSKET